MIAFILAPVVWGYNLVYWLRMRAKRRRMQTAKFIQPAPNPWRYLPVASGIFTAVSVILALAAGATLAVILLPMFIIVGIAIVLSLLAKALGGSDSTKGD